MSEHRPDITAENDDLISGNLLPGRVRADHRDRGEAQPDVRVELGERVRTRAISIEEPDLCVRANGGRAHGESATDAQRAENAGVEP